MNPKSSVGKLQKFCSTVFIVKGSIKMLRENGTILAEQQKIYEKLT
jgi:hypothetical protein